MPHDQGSGTYKTLPTFPHTAEIDILEEVKAFYSYLYRMDEVAITSDIISNLKGDLP